MKACRATPAILLLALAATSSAHAQTTASDAPTPHADTIVSSLSEILSLATLGAVTTQDQAAQVTKSGEDYRVQLPLRGFSTPPDAEVNALARPLDNGILDIKSLTFPSAGTVEPAMPNAGATRIAYSIGEQTIRAQIDPGLTQPSSFNASLSAVKVQSEQGATHSEQLIDRYDVNGTLLPEAAGRISLSSTAKATNWHLNAHADRGLDVDSLVRTLSGHFSVDGLDRAHGTQLLAAVRGLMADAPAPTPGQTPAPSPARRQELRALIDAVAGLLTRFEAAETLDDVRFTVGTATSGTIGRVRVNMAGDTAAQRVDARIDIGMDQLAMSTLSPETAVYLPHHVDIKSALKGVPAGPLMALLRAVTAQDADPAATQAQLTALLDDPTARIGIESLTFDSGPVHVAGSLRVVPRDGGQMGADVHFSAMGLDTLIAQAQGNPTLQQVLPMLFIAKGMGRPDGDATVWDIALGGGPLTINGVPIGQSAARKR